MKNLVYKLQNLILFAILFSANIYSAKILHAADKPLIAIEKEKKQQPSGEIVTTTIHSDFISVKRKSGIIEFSKNVITEREDTSFLADRMLVYYDEKKKDKLKTESNDSSESAIKKIDAFDNVRLFNQEFVATGETGNYDPNTGIFIIEGNVIFNNGTSIANGSKFIYNIKTKKSDLFGQQPQTGELKDTRALVIIGDNIKENKKDKKKKDEGTKNPTDNSTKINPENQQDQKQ